MVTVGDQVAIEIRHGIERRAPLVGWANRRPQ